MSSTPYDTIHEAIGVVAAGVGNPDETRSAAEVAVSAAKRLGRGHSDDHEGWQALAMGLANLAMILLSDRLDSTGEAPLGALRSCADRFPRQ